MKNIIVNYLNNSFKDNFLTKLYTNYKISKSRVRNIIRKKTMRDLQLLLSIIKSDFKNIWKVFLVIIFVSLLANLFTVLQPLIFASMLEVTIPDNLSIFENQSNNNIKQNNFFDLNFIGNSINEYINNNLLTNEVSNFKSLIYLSSFFFNFVLLASL